MQFLRTLFWVILAVLAVVFSFNNWTPVTLNLWGSVQLDTKLPVLLLVTFLIGLVPMLIVHRASRWSLRRRAEAAERTLADIRALSAAQSAAHAGDTPPGPIPPAAVPIAVPPGVA